MSFKEELKKKIPERYHLERDFKALLEMAEKEGLETKDELLGFLDKGIKEVEGWIKDNATTGGTIVRVLRDKVIKLEGLRKVKKMVEEFL